jgi:8-oxo-dGTP diphosphatase
VLLGRRMEGRDLAGAWEFPGGKVDPGESALGALARELDEELGIDIDPGSCSELIAVPFAYAHKRIVLDVYRVAAFDGTPRGREKQALAWAPPATLDAYSMPAADRPVVAALRQPDRYLITPEPSAADLEAPSGYLERLSRALAARPGRVQLRARGADRAALARLAEAVAGLCHESGCSLLINSALPGARGLARALGTGIHLTAADLASGADADAGDLPLAASCHDAKELALAEARGVEFVVLGPVQPTRSHPQATPLGWDGFSRLRETCSLPIYALGGLAPSELPLARRHGAQGIAGIRGFQA